MSKAKQKSSKIATFLFKLERGIRLFFFAGACILIGYLVISRLPYLYETIQREGLVQLAAVDERWYLGIYKVYRNLFYLLYMPYFVLLIIAGIIHALADDMGSMIKVGSAGLGLLLFWTFSYAIAGLILDLFAFILVLNQTLLRSGGVIR